MLVCEYIDYMNAYRVFDPEHPSHTVAYEDEKRHLFYDDWIMMKFMDGKKVKEK